MKIQQNLLRKIKPWLLFGLALIGFLVPFPTANPVPRERFLQIDARRSYFTPSAIRLNRGDSVTIRLVSHDVVHGLTIDGQDFKLVAEPGNPVTGTFVAESSGVFTFRCQVTCGNTHPFMLGKLSVTPDLLLFRGSMLLILLSVVLLFNSSFRFEGIRS